MTVLRVATLGLVGICALAVPAAADNFPASLNPVGDGYPVKGSVCRQLGESPATAGHIDGSAILVGCPGSPESPFVRKYLAKTGGQVVDEIDGFTLISISQGQQAAMATARDAEAKAAQDAFRSGGQLRCALSPTDRQSQCNFAIARKGGLTIVRISRPDGGSREIYFANGKVVGADVDKSAGSAKRRVVTTRELDLFAVAIGDERYEIPADSVQRDPQ